MRSYVITPIRDKGAPKLTDVSVRQRPQGVYFDTKTPAFGNRIGKLRKAWIIIKGRKRTKVRLGHYSEMSLADARNRALGSPMNERPHINFPDALVAFFDATALVTICIDSMTLKVQFTLCIICGRAITHHNHLVHHGGMATSHIGR